ncbi:trypsin-like serine peptidase [Streptomyces sp. NPDC101393]|uniref:trypsin-like serine peptidase n=1 Tax=Streptomyces sp. NPDC101393 TaxID=3366141 RepID=UPI00381B097C
METSERGPVPADEPGGDLGTGPIRDRNRAPDPDAAAPGAPPHGPPPRTGRGRAGLPLRATLALALLTVVGGGSALLLGSGRGDPDLAAGDVAAGVYLPARSVGEGAAAAVRAGPYTEQPGPAVGRTPSGRHAPLPASRPPEAAPTAPSPPIGALFSPEDDSEPRHHCTASVVHAPAGDLVVTAAHCVHDGGFHTRLVFAPGLHDGIVPYGLWVPTRIDVDPRWISDRDPDRDVAFLRVRRVGPKGSGAAARDGGRIEDVTGAERIRFDAPAGRPAQLTGYPDDQDAPIGCRHPVDAASPTQLRFSCAGFPNGTSGGPMLTDLDPATGTGTLIGVIGGQDEGGDDATSYSSRLGAEVAALYRRATS